MNKNNTFLRFCQCIFESDTVKSDCPVQIFRKKMKYIKIKYRQLVNLTSFTVFFWRYLKKKKSENNQLTGHFQSFLIYFFSSPDPKSEFFSVNQLIRNSGLTHPSQVHKVLNF